MLAAQCAFATGPADLLSKADGIKLVDHVEFTKLLQTLDGRVAELSPADREYLEYLHGWSSAYNGDNEAAIKKLAALQDSRIE